MPNNNNIQIDGNVPKPKGQLKPYQFTDDIINVMYQSSLRNAPKNPFIKPSIIGQFGSKILAPIAAFDLAGSVGGIVADQSKPISQKFNENLKAGKTEKGSIQLLSDWLNKKRNIGNYGPLSQWIMDTSTNISRGHSQGEKGIQNTIVDIKNQANKIVDNPKKYMSDSWKEFKRQFDYPKKELGKTYNRIKNKFTEPTPEPISQFGNISSPTFGKMPQREPTKVTKDVIKNTLPNFDKLFNPVKTPNIPIPMRTQ